MGLETSCLLWQSNQNLDAFPQSAPRIQVLLCCIRLLLWEFVCPAFANGQLLMLQIKINAQTPHRGIPKLDGVSSSRVYVTAELTRGGFLSPVPNHKGYIYSVRQTKAQDSSQVQAHIPYILFICKYMLWYGPQAEFTPEGKSSHSHVLAQAQDFLPRVWKGAAWQHSCTGAKLPVIAAAVEP